MTYYYVDDISKKFGCSKRSVWRWMKDGKIKFEIESCNGCIKKAKIPETELEWIENHSKCGRPQGAKNKKKATPQKLTQIGGSSSLDAAK